MYGNPYGAVQILLQILLQYGPYQISLMTIGDHYRYSNYSNYCMYCKHKPLEFKIGSFPYLVWITHTHLSHKAC